MKKLLLSICTFIFLLFCSSVSIAQWQQTNGPYGGNVISFAVSGTNIFAGTSEVGMFLSTDNGSNWTAVNTGLTNTTVKAIAVSGINIFAGTNGGVFLSTNNGGSWTAVNMGLTNTTVYALAVSGTNIFAGTGGGVFLSTNNGGSWTAVNTGLTNTTVNTLSVNGTNIFAGTNGGGAFLSANNGSSWTAVNSGLANQYVTALAMNGTNIFAGAWGGVYLSTNNGSSWTAVNTGLTNTTVYALAVSGTNIFAGTLGGIFFSANNGSSWTAVNTGLINYAINALAVSGTNIFAGTNGGGVFLSANNGSSWMTVNTGLINTTVNALAVSGTNIFAGTKGAGIFLSTDNGNNWTAVNTGLTNNTPVNALAVSGTNIFAGTGGGVFLSTNDGSSWTAMNTGLTYQAINALAVSGTNIFAGSWAGAGVFLSTNNGSSWTAVNTGLSWKSKTVNTLAVSGTNIFSGTAAAGVFLSTNNGSSWTAVNTGLTGLSQSVNALAINGTNIFAGTGGGVFLSTNNGNSWTAVNNGLTNANILSLAISGTNVFAGTGGGGVFLSTNNGSSWTVINTGLTNTVVNTLAVSGTNILAGTGGGGVWKRALSELICTSTITAGGTTSFCQGDSVKLTASSGSSYLWNTGDTTSSITVKTTGNFAVTIKDSTNCSATSDTTRVIVNPDYSVNATATICQGDSVMLGGIYRKTAVTYTDVLKTIQGCDSTVTTDLNVLPVNNKTQTITLCAGDSIKVGLKTYKATGVYIDTLKAVSTCDSIVTTNLTVLPANTLTQALTICSGDSITVGTKTYKTTGIYTDVLKAVNTCDSIVATNLTVLPTNKTTQTLSICSGDSITVGTKTYKTTGIYTDILKAVNTCDSIVITNLTVLPANTFSQTITKCEGQTLTVGKNTYTKSGTYTDVLTSSKGCDSTVTTNLTVLPANTFSQTITKCAGQSLTVGKNTYTKSGTYTDVLISYKGCDSTVTTNLTVLPANAFSQTITKCAGQSVTIGNNTYTKSGTYTDVLISYKGCDSTVTTNLTVLPANTFSQTITKCAGQSITVGSKTYTKSGIYTDTLISYQGCDSTVTTNLTVLPANTFSQTITKCEGQTLTVGKNTYAKSGTYTDVLISNKGCDSTVTTNLTVLPANTFSQTKTICSGESVRVGNSTYTKGGTYTDVLTSNKGCDSTVTTIITIATPSSCELVWPGDANHDGIANNFDLLAIGIAYGKSGAVRSGATLNWVGQPAADWADTLSDGTNYKHADCDGNGSIKISDIAAIIQNYGFTHNKIFAGSTPTPSDPTLSLNVTNSTVKSGVPVKALVELGTSTVTASNAYGIAFTVNFDPALVDSATLGFDLVNSWLGTKGTNVIALDYTNFSNGSIDLAITKIDHNNANGFGTIGELTFTTSKSFTGNKILNLSVSKVKMVSKNETDLPVNLGKDAVIITGVKEIELQNVVRLYPNPAQDKLFIEVNSQQQNFSVKIFNALGMQVYELQEQQSNKAETLYTVDLSHQPDGVYFAVISNGQQVVNKKVMVVR